MNEILERFEEGNFQPVEWESVLKSVIQEYTLQGYGKRQLYAKVEASVKKAMERVAGMSVPWTPSAEDKAYINEIYEGAQVNDQVKMFMIFSRSREFENYRFFIDAEKNYTIYKLTGKRDKNTIEVVSLAHHETLKREIFSSVVKILGDKAHTKQAVSLIEYLLNNKDLFSYQDVKFVSEPKDEETYTFKLIPEVESVNTYEDLVAWKEWLSRLSDPMAFGAWIWSIYEPEHCGRQCLYLQGPDGEDGKSVVSEVVYSMFGAEYASSLSSLGALSTQERFGLSGIYGKRLILVPDLNNSNLLKYPIFRQLTGEDPVTIEYKGQTPFMAKIRVRFWVCSNYSVNVSAQKHETSRLLWIVVSPPTERTVRWKIELKNEFHAFLQYCKFAYAEKCRDHYQIESVAATQTTRDNIGNESVDIVDYLSVFFDIDKTRMDWSIPKQDFFHFLRDEMNIKNTRTIKEYKVALGEYGLSDFLANGGRGVHIANNSFVYRGIRKKQYGNGDNGINIDNFELED